MTTFSASSGKGLCSAFASSQRVRWDKIYALCRVKSLPFNAAGEVIKNDAVWKVYEFTWLMDAILLWLAPRDAGGAARSFTIRAAREPAGAEATRELAEIQSARFAVATRSLEWVEPLSH